MRERYFGARVGGVLYARQWSIEREIEAIACPLLAVQGIDDEYGTLEQIRGAEARLVGSNIVLDAAPDGIPEIIEATAREVTTSKSELLCSSARPRTTVTLLRPSSSTTSRGRPRSPCSTSCARSASTSP